MAALSDSQKAKLTVIFISVDPARDTPRIAADYARKFHPMIRGYTGDSKEIASMLRLYRRLDVVPDVANGKPYLVDHTTSILWFENQKHSKNIPASFVVSDLLADLKQVL